jgi:cytochrome P450
VDYRRWTNFFSLDAIADIGLSEKLGFLDQGNDLCVAERLDGSTFEVYLRQCLYATSQAQSELVWSYDWYKLIAKLTKIFSPYYRRLWKLNEGWDGVVLRRASERWRRYEKREKLDDFFQALMVDNKANIHNLEWGEVVAEVSIMMNAGSTTTAIAMANVLFQLVKHPAILKRLREEIDSVLDDEEIIAPFEKVKHLPYLRACLDESLRLYPPTSHGLPRETPPEGASIMGEWVPGNTTVSMSAYVVHRDPQVFPDPEMFKPERWLGETGKELQPYFVAFSAGSRGCIGRNISYLEQTVLLASVVHRYKFDLLYPGWEPKRRETFNLHLNSLPLRIRHRQKT